MLTQNHEKSPASYVSVLSGLVLGSVYAFVECMFTPAYYPIRYAFFPNYGFYLFFEIMLPCLVCGLLYTVFIKKHDKALLSFYFVFAAFYAVYMPARIMHRNDMLDWYLLFVKPVIYTSMLIGFKYTAFLFDKIWKDSNLQHSGRATLKEIITLFALPSVLFSGFIFIPPAIDVMNLLHLPVWALMPVALVYCAFAVFAKKILKRG